MTTHPVGTMLTGHVPKQGVLTRCGPERWPHRGQRLRASLGPARGTPGGFRFGTENHRSVPRVSSELWGIRRTASPVASTTWRWAVPTGTVSSTSSAPSFRVAWSWFPGHCPPPFSSGFLTPKGLTHKAKGGTLVQVPPKFPNPERVEALRTGHPPGHPVTRSPLTRPGVNSQPCISPLAKSKNSSEKWRGSSLNNTFSPT